MPQFSCPCPSPTRPGARFGRRFWLAGWWAGLASTLGTPFCTTAQAQNLLPQSFPQFAQTGYFVPKIPPPADAPGLATEASPPPTAGSDSGKVAPRLRLVVGLGVGTYGLLLGGLAAGWYTGQPTRFRWFNDAPEWAQLDKAGHFWGAFHESRAVVDALRWAGLPERQARIWGAPAGFLLQSPIEYFDGRSAGYGASWTDLAANAAGSLALAGELALWNELRVFPKFSAHPTGFAPQRPNVLGHSLAQRLLKDYNGQTYWLAVDVGAFLPATSRWPRWLCLAAGYGAQGMVYGDPAQNRAAGYRTYRQFYFGPDLHLLNLRPRSKLLRAACYVLSIVRLPAPALEVRSTGRVRLHAVVF